MSSDEMIYIKVRHSMLSVRLENILYMEKQNRQITIHTVSGEDICFYGKYDSVMPLLDERFIHPHQSYVINMQYIYRLGNHSVKMFGGDMIEMGNKCFRRLRKAFDEYIAANFKSRPVA